MNKCIITNVTFLRKLAIKWERSIKYNTDYISNALGMSACTSIP